MAIQAQLNSGFVFTENAVGLNNLSFNLQQPNPIPKFLDDHPSISQIISAHIEIQRIEIDQYINSESERMRIALQEQRRQQTSLLLKKYGSKIQSLLKQKDEEIAKAASRNAELQEFLRRVEMERVTWQRLAQESEAAAAAMSGTMERLREAAAGGAAEDAESCCCGEEREREREGEERERRRRVCRWCNSRESCVIMLPCRHLCSCRDCDAFLDSCPVCNLPKKASLEALF